MPFGAIEVDHDDRVATITLNRPDVLNALSTQLTDEVVTAASELDRDPGIGAIILTGNETAFAAGANTMQMSTLSFAEVSEIDLFEPWTSLAGTV